MQDYVENGTMKIVRGELMVLKVEKITTNLFMLKEETPHEVDVCVVSTNK